MRAWWVTAWKRDDGQSLIEYSLILALVAASLVAVLILFRDNLGDSYGRVGNRMDSAGLRGPAAGSASEPPSGAGADAASPGPGEAESRGPGPGKRGTHDQ
jgi:Flp pilus assembly pilin Flp